MKQRCRRMIFGLIIALLVVGGLYALLFRRAPEGVASDYRNATYSIDGNPVTLANGVSIVKGPAGESDVTTTRIFGNEARGDLNGDGTDDIAFILTQDGGGSGTFVYIVAALKTVDGYHGTDGILLGDRIAPQTTAIRDGIITVNYADRKPGESFAERPTIGVSKYVKVVQDSLVEVK